MQYIIFTFYMWALWVYGLYFENHLYLFTIVLASVIGIMMIYETIRLKKLAINIWLLPLPFLYLFPLLLGRAESIQATMKHVIIMSLIVLLFFLLEKLKEEKDGDQKLKQIITAISWSVVLVSYAVLLRLFAPPEFIMGLNKGVSGLGARLGGFVQYPNAFASILASMLLLHLVASTKEEKLKGFLLQTALLPGLFTLLLLTESRGAWVLFAFVYMLSVVMVKAERQFHYLLVSAYVFLSGGILYLSITIDGLIYANWLSVLLFILFAGLLYYLQPRRWSKFGKSGSLMKFTLFFVPVLTLLLVLDVFFRGAVFHFLPSALQNRLSFGIGTFTDRMYYWSDVWNHLSIIGFLGRGGDGWSYVMYRIQSFPYITSEIHSSLLDIFIDTGVVGLAYCIVIVFFILRNLWRTRSMIFPAVLFLLLHSMIDFTFSYPIMIFWLLLLYVTGRQEQRAPKGNYIPSILFFILLVSSLFLSIKFIKAEQSFQSALSASNNDEVKYYLHDALMRNSWQTAYTSMAVEQGLFTEEENRLLLEQALRYEPRNARLHYQLAEVYKKLGNGTQTEKHYENMLAYDRYDTKKYEVVQDYYIEKMKKAQQTNDKKQAKQAKEKATKIYETTTQLAKDIKTKPLTNQRNFHQIKSQ